MYQALRSAAVRWLTLLVGLPATPTRHRVGVWRKLQRMGAVRLRGSAWILPETAETKELFEWLVQEVQSVREIGRASCRGRGVDLGGRRIIKKKKKIKSSESGRCKKKRV